MARSRQGKILIVGAEVQDGDLAPAASASKNYRLLSRQPHAFLAANLISGATAGTDRLPSYVGAPSVRHDPHVIGGIAAHIVLPLVRRLFSNLEVSALGVYLGLRRKHVQSYLDQFVFRFNRRRTRHAAFRSLLGIPASLEPLAYRS